MAGLNLVSSITLHSKTGSKNIDAITVGYSSGTVVLGNKFAAYKGKKSASINLRPDDRARELYIWTDSSQLVVKGVMLVLVRGTVLDLSFDLEPTQATVRKDKPGELGSGLLLGIAAAAKPSTEVLSAVSFAFLMAPLSAALAVDMAKIDIDSAKITPRHKLNSTIKGNIDIEASCPSYSETVVYKNAYTQLPAILAVKARVEALMGAPLFSGSSTRLKRSAELVATERKTVEGIGAVSDTWQSPVRGAGAGQPDSLHKPAARPPVRRGCCRAINAVSDVLQVYDVFDDAVRLTPEAGTSTTVGSPATKFIVKPGETVQCSYLYWTRELTTSYTVTATLFFDGQGSAAWTTSVGGEQESLRTATGGCVVVASLVAD